MKSVKTLVLAISSLFVLPALAQTQDPKSERTGLAMMRLHAMTFSSPNESVTSGSIWTRLRQDFRIGEVNSALVRSHESKFAANSAYFNRTINRSTPYMYHIVHEVKKRNMPAEIALLPFIESAYVTKARSHVGASGLWQFMPATGRHYGLEQTPMYDGRHDVYAATDAALNYLQYLYGLFGDWSLALAAYNWGEGNVSRAIRQAQANGLEPTYENLRMPAETRNYVPKLLAVRNLVNNPQAYGLRLPEIANEPYFKAVQVSAPMDIMAAAFLANIPESEFLALNPAFKTPVFIPKDGNRKMLLPVSAVKTFENNFKDADTKTLLSWDVFTPSTSMDLTQLATQTGSTVADLKRLNGISGNSIAAGRTILLNRNTTLALQQPQLSGSNTFAKLDYDPVPDTFVEQAPVLPPKTTLSGSQSETRVTSVVTAKETVMPSTPVVVPTSVKHNHADVVIAPPSSLTNPATTVAHHDNSLAPAQEVKESVQAALSIPQPSAQTLIVGTQKAPVFVPEEALKKPERSTSDAVVPNREPKEPTEKVQAASENTLTQQAEDGLNELVERQKRQHEQAQVSEKKSNSTSVAAVQASSNKNHLATNSQVVAKVMTTVQKRPETTVSNSKERNDLALKSKTAVPNSKRVENAKTKTLTHKVEAGDTLYNIAKRHQIEVADLLAVNNIKGNNIKLGQVLKIVVENKKTVVVKEKNDKNDKSNNNKTNTSKNLAEQKKPNSNRKSAPVVHTVKKGDTLESIAKRYNLDVGDLKRANGGNSRLQIGQKVKL
ncbi:MAG: LysM peptidoglycan-binding domain-containing protein [Alysiella sp.]|uniref:LysM peptidoglycan-binding domain-containing protein n=1 Tax=Alysiella sp. TaxID=1872483 RepID=UPI0026DB350F|nr:LysM peptidoglycan-binding domain-containing protein [Alysiella sp.]MDO4434116.1 LysM peptidoglycan-binding domain-containing protein [Alysiella sp.]